MELELKHLAPYLPYGLRVIMEGKKTNVAWLSTKYISVIRPNTTGEIKRIKWLYARINVKPILRPLSDLTKEIEHNGEKFVPFYELDKVDEEYFISIEDGETIYFEDFCGINIYEVTRCYSLIQKLLEWHFDVFGLIEAGLAIDINTITQK